MPNDPDRDLRALFQRLREKDVAAAPAFTRVIAGTHPEARKVRIRPRIAIAVAATVVLVAGTLAVVYDGGTKGDDAPDLLSGLTTSVWRAPTDFLLDLPQSELTRTVPTFGAPLPGLTPRDLNPERLKTPRTGRGNS